MIKESDAILVVNYDKKGIKNYVWWNTFVEMAFAHILDKKIYLINPVPDMIYTDEMLAFQPIILHWNIERIG